MDIPDYKKPVKVVHSKVDPRVTKMVFSYRDQDVEYVYVDNGTHKDIVCVPSQTGCNLGCQFCFLTHREDKRVVPVHPTFTHLAVTETLLETFLRTGSRAGDILLISFMGAGEPLLDIHQLLAACLLIKSDPDFKRMYKEIRFGFATSLPQGTSKALLELDHLAQQLNIDLKLHWSLHSVQKEQRAALMPHSTPVEEALHSVFCWSGRKEIHYTLFEGNDSREDAAALASIAVDPNLGRLMPVKLLEFTEFPGDSMRASTHTEEFAKYLLEDMQGLSDLIQFHHHPPKVEIYRPPGQDIHAACGAFDIPPPK